MLRSHTMWPAALFQFFHAFRTWYMIVWFTFIFIHAVYVHWARASYLLNMAKLLEIYL